MLGLLNVSWAGLLLDGLAIFIIIGFAVLSAKRGFIDCLFGLIASLVALILAFSLFRGLLDWTNGLFGLQELLENACAKALGKISAMNVDVSNGGLAMRLEESNIPSFLAKYILESVGNSTLPEGTTLAMVAGAPLGKFLTSVIAFFVLYFLINFLISCLRKILSSLINKIPLVGGANRILGFVVGLLKGVLVISGVVAVLSLLPSNNITSFFHNSLFLRLLYNHNPINAIIGWILV